jgi:hypothetical protein
MIETGIPLNRNTLSDNEYSMFQTRLHAYTLQYNTHNNVILYRHSLYSKQILEQYQITRLIHHVSM